MTKEEKNIILDMYASERVALKKAEEDLGKSFKYFSSQTHHIGQMLEHIHKKQCLEFLMDYLKIKFRKEEYNND